MSEHQYYEFRAIDRQLTDAELKEVSKTSSRANFTRTGFSIAYDYGRFRGNIDELMEKYFDAFLYYANWGQRILMLRVPMQSLDLKALDSAISPGFNYWTHGEHAILRFDGSREGFIDDAYESDWMSQLLPLRNEILRGDLRPAYLGWLAGLCSIDMEDDWDEPPVPPGLKTLTPAQSSLKWFLFVPTNLLEAAAVASPESAPEQQGRNDLAAWLKTVPLDQKDQWLLQVATDGDGSVRTRMLQEFRKSQPAATVTNPRRTAGEILAAYQVLDDEEDRKIEEQRAREQAEREQLAERIFQKELDYLAKRLDAAWQEINRKVSTKQSHQYKLAIETLTQLRALAIRENNLDEFLSRLQDLRLNHSKKTTFLGLVDKAELRS